MKDTFPKFIKGAAQQVARRTALKTFGVGLAGLALARLAVSEAHAIINGTPDGNAHPNVGAGIFLTSLWPPTPAPVVCGSGILIHPRVMLTAGHGTHLAENAIRAGIIRPEDFRVSFASDASDSATWRAVSGIVTHPDFAPQSHFPDGAGNIPVPDVGVLILEEAVTGVSPSPLPKLGFLDALQARGDLKTGSDRARFTVIGYGVEPGPNPGQIPFPPDGLRRVAESEFLNLHERWLFVTQNVAHDDGGSCTCDSGGPTFWTDPATGEATLVAIVSRGSIYRDARYRVDTGEALSFLKALIARVEAGELF